MPASLRSRALHLRDTVPPRLAATLLPGIVVRLPTPGALYLTFDDGPSSTTTPALLDRLGAVGAHATFFLLGGTATRHRDLVRRVALAGHAVGAHGWSHVDPWRHPAQAVPEMARAAGWLEDVLGARVAYVRPPYGHLTPGVMRWARQTHRRVALWNRMPGDFRPRATPETVARAALRGDPAGSLVVLHEGSARAGVVLPAVAAILAALPARGLAAERLP